MIILSNSTTSFITLRLLSQKQKCDITNFTKPSTNVVLMNNNFKKVTVALTDTYHSNINTQNTELILLVGQVEKKINLIKNSLGKVKGSLEDIKGTLRNMQEIIGEVLQILA